MALLDLFRGRVGPSADDQTIFSALSGPTIDRDDAKLIKDLLAPIPVKVTATPDNDIRSLTVPRTKFREKILSDSSFRRALRNLPFKLQDVHARTMELGDSVVPEVYVKDTKYNKLSHSTGKSLVSLDVKMRWLEEALGDWGYVRIPAIILLTIVGFVGYGAYRLATFAGKVVTEYSEATAAATTSDAGLERAVQARSGTVSANSPKIAPKLGSTPSKNLSE